MSMWKSFIAFIAFRKKSSGYNDKNYKRRINRIDKRLPSWPRGKGTTLPMQGVWGLIPGQGTRSHMPHWKARSPSLFLTDPPGAILLSTGGSQLTGRVLDPGCWAIFHPQGSCAQDNLYFGANTPQAPLRWKIRYKSELWPCWRGALLSVSQSGV